MRNSSPGIVLLLLLLASATLSACSPPSESSSAPLFTRLLPEETGITFSNEILENEGFNVLEYEYFFNGGGVAVGDLNQDGLPDLYFTANMQQDQLYLNKGNMTFENITEQAGLIHEPGWHTGVTMADVNGDGFLDIYVARSGQVSTDRRRNLLYINNGDLTFTEKAEEVGLDSPAYSNHASFFDYDRDGDLDMYLLNHPIRRYSYFVVDFMKSQRDSLAGDKLFRNDNGTFIDVSASAGIIGNPLGFGLSATVSDINQDGWPDLYVANDYIEEDYLYINQQDGTFKESIREWITTASYSSMGADIADINNDGRVDILTLDMMADNHERQKILKGPESYLYYEQMRANGYHDQAMRNMLHVRTGSQSFTEVGRMAGISFTDWSWAPLLADFDNDGYKDALITNGYLRDYTNLDFLENILAQAREASALGESFSSFEMVRQMPSTPIPNHIYRNNGHLQFEDMREPWAFNEPTFSNGAVYADLDVDGDLDLVINNINQAAFIYQNEATSLTNHRYLRLSLEGPPGNPFGLGTTVTVTTPGGTLVHEVNPSRGFLSSIEPVVHIGVGNYTEVDLMVTWPNGYTQSLTNQATNQQFALFYTDASPADTQLAVEAPLFTELDNTLPFTHRENDFVDFEREPLLPHMLSRLGPAMAHMDVNRDGLEDLFIGGAHWQPGALFLQQLDGSFNEADVPAFQEHSMYEDVDAAFLDIDNDGDPDLYVASGGNEQEDGQPIYQDRLYVNNGFGRFDDATAQLPTIRSSTGTVAPFDYDQDGDLDLFIGGRTTPGAYPTAPRSYLLQNNGGTFSDVTPQEAPELQYPGMITDAAWGNLDASGSLADLVLVGEWMPPTVWSYHPERGFEPNQSITGFDSMNGWWNTITLDDLDGDGDLDVLAGNKGLNSWIRASSEDPVTLYASDMDANGKLDAVITHALQGSRHTIYWRNELVQQIPRWGTVFPSQTTYARATFDEISQHIPPDAQVFRAIDFETRLFENKGGGVFTPIELPMEAQIAPVQSFVIVDFNQDGQKDILLAGNNHATRAAWGRDNAGQGLLLLGKPGLAYTALPPAQLGSGLDGDVRAMAMLNTPSNRLLVVAENNGPTRMFGISTRKR